MPLTVEAIYENGVLKPVEPLALAEHVKVKVTIEALPLGILQAYGLMGWKGDAETLERVALDTEFLPEQASWS
jgi:predicted DNA-binding antitoxin AbrB/MazE fold protein